MTPLVERFRAQARQCAEHGSPLTAALLYGAAADYEGGGPVRELLAPHAEDPSGTVPSLRLAGALHRLVLERRAPGLALHYPSVGGTAPPERAWDAARAVVAEQSDELRSGLLRPVQTNEVGRAAVLFGALCDLPQPLRLLEIGASAGLNLHVDRFAYDTGERVLGNPASPVRLMRPWSGRTRSGTPRIVERAGCDRAPLDPASPADRLTLTSYVWADQVERFERLRAALQVAAAHPLVVESLTASAFLDRELAEPRPGVTTVVWHSLVWQYLETAERTAIDQVLTRAGRRATPEAPLAHVSLEPDRVGDGHRFTIRRTVWPGGQSQVLGTANGHGPPVVWS